MSKAETHERIQTFLEELTALTRRTGIVVNGCWHCDSPRLLVDGAPWEYDAEGEYAVMYQRGADPEAYTHTYARLQWRNPGERLDAGSERRVPGTPALRVEVRRTTRNGEGQE